MTQKDVMRLERELIGKASVWDRITAEECQLLAYYNDGIHDMASLILEALAKEDGAL